MAQNADMWNAVFKEHGTQFPLCNGNLHWDSQAEQQRGWAWREKAVCNTCRYKSSMYSLYTEEEPASGTRGRKSATINKGFQVGLSQVPIGNASLRTLMLAANIPAPSEKGMQIDSNIVGDKIISVNKSDMIRRSKRLQNINEARGHTTNVVDIEADGTYNNPAYGGIGITPFQAGTQAMYPVAENLTKNKSVIALTTVNKLCCMNKFHTNDEFNNVNEANTCACTATIGMDSSIGDEGAMATQALRFLKDNANLEVRGITTDPDSSSYKSAIDLYNEGTTSTIPEHFLDTRHLSANHRKYIKNFNDIQQFMTGRTKRIRERIRNNFATDLSKRCQAEFNKAFAKQVSTVHLKRYLSYAVDAIVECYKGNHSLCIKLSFVCKGAWIKTSTYLENDFKLDDSDECDNMLRSCINYRLGPVSIERTQKNTNTQKVEAVNKKLKKSLPPSNTFKRNFHGRAHSAVHSINHGPAESISKLVEAMSAPIVKGSKVAKRLKLEQELNTVRRESVKTLSYKKKRCVKRDKLFKLYEESQEKKEVLYRKDMLLKKQTAGRLGQGGIMDHSYVKKTQLTCAVQSSSKQ